MTKVKITMYLESDTIFSNGITGRDGTDLELMLDSEGFPYYKATTFKGIFREMLENYLGWIEEENKEEVANRLLGFGTDKKDDESKLVFSDFTLSEAVRKTLKEKIGNEVEIRDALSNRRVAISIGDNGVANDGSLRSLRAVNKGLYLYSELQCKEEDFELVEEVISLIKWIGTRRNRGFGKVKLTCKKGE